MAVRLIDFQTKKNEIRKYEVITFDVFDTLLVRKYSIKPTDLFYFMALEKGLDEKSANAFMSLRVNAEALSREKKLLIDGHEEVNIHEIYENISGYDLITAEDEISFERKCLLRREYLSEIYNVAVELNKRIYAISDIYYDKKTLELMLHEKGFRFDGVYTSCDYGVGKYNKRLFLQFLSLEGLAAQSVLHFGDNVHSDFNMPVEIGINAIHVPKNYESLFLNSAINLGSIQIIHNSKSKFFGFQLAYLSRLLDDGKKLSAAQLFGVIYAAPLVFLFAKWLEAKAHEKSFAKIFLMARDGYTLAEVLKAGGFDLDYEILNCSRRSLLFPSIKLDSESWRVFFESSMSLKLNDVIDGLYIDKCEDLKLLANRVARGKDTFGEFNKEQKEIFLAESLLLIDEQVNIEYASAVSYFEKINLGDSKSAVVDVGWSLSSQAAIEKMLSKKIQGLYVGTSERAPFGDNVSGFLFELGGDDIWKSIFHNAVELLEMPFLALEDKFNSYGNDFYNKGRPGCEESYRRCVAKEVREMVLDFTRAAGGVSFSKADMDNSLATLKELFFHLSCYPTLSERYLLGSIPHDRHIASVGHKKVADYWLVNGEGAVKQVGGRGLTRHFILSLKERGVKFTIIKSVNYILRRFVK